MKSEKRRMKKEKLRAKCGKRKTENYQWKIRTKKSNRKMKHEK